MFVQPLQKKLELFEKPSPTYLFEIVKLRKIYFILLFVFLMKKHMH